MRNTVEDRLADTSLEELEEQKHRIAALVLTLASYVLPSRVDTHTGSPEGLGTATRRSEASVEEARLQDLLTILSTQDASQPTK